MPGVFEQTSDDSPTTANASNDVTMGDANQPDDTEPIDHAIGDDAADEPNASADETPVREMTQTDKINRFMLKSFLEHMNSHVPNQQFPAASNSSADTADSSEDNEW